MPRPQTGLCCPFTAEPHTTTAPPPFFFYYPFCRCHLPLLPKSATAVPEADFPSLPSATRVTHRRHLEAVDGDATAVVVDMSFGVWGVVWDCSLMVPSLAIEQ
ncbi:hypothetical protein Tsubulata_044372 [Turnera subulata]|uniref:Uncharacterized protein n=1 Tax=Turnera subulata TaxID=218843 RepID=A0A9Q0JQ05_9ROSI|nr:hypothetical protein Tsubulata_044372 [Turnera subulata]